MTRLKTLTSADTRGLQIRWGHHPSPFGPCMIATTQGGVCWLAFVGAKDPDAVLAELERQWTGATLIEDSAATAEAARAAFEAPRTLDLVVRGTAFQLEVWRALLEIPFGETTSYSALAESVGRPKAARAIGGAVGANPISLLIPCHRVVRKSGRFEGYRWGVEVKRALLEAESKVLQPA